MFSSSGSVTPIYECQIPQNETDEVQIHVHESAVQMYPNELPPDDRKEYEFAPRPCQYIPPVGSNLFVYSIQHPSYASPDDAFILSRVPKLRSRPVDPSIVWGICLVDQISSSACTIALGSIHCFLFAGIMFSFLLDSTFAFNICICIYMGSSLGFLCFLSLQFYLAGWLFDYERSLKRMLKPQNKGPLAADKAMRWDRKSLLSLFQRLRFIPVYCVPRLRSCFALWQNAVDSISPCQKDNLSLPDGGGLKVRCVSIWKKDSYIRSRLR